MSYTMFITETNLQSLKKVENISQNLQPLLGWMFKKREKGVQKASNHFFIFYSQSLAHEIVGKKVTLYKKKPLLYCKNM
jgi:uncharacterized protein YehS (DUF1456 family)